ncbi:sigma factor-like helix-turn-helix DNA-binding protein [Streptomyces sp. NPDC001401]|uniref:sigma factor-like helix-turn-helix DNA-binding protein n=1 Tax=Streptomyces sp. NPDC001401 TaxID=3364570 RepID=UPI0036BFCC2A
MLRHFSGITSYQEIAAACETPVGTVRSRLNRARAKPAQVLLSTAAQSHDDFRAHRAQQAGVPGDPAGGSARRFALAGRRVVARGDRTARHAQPRQRTAGRRLRSRSTRWLRSSRRSCWRRPRRGPGLQGRPGPRSDIGAQTRPAEASSLDSGDLPGLGWRLAWRRMRDG